MAYKCPKCGHASEEAGNCPTCNVEMVESKKEEDSSQPTDQPAEPQEDSQPENN